MFMKNILRTIFPAMLFLAFTGVPALAQTKIATVDLSKLFRDYYKTKLASQAIQSRANDLDKDYTSMAADWKKQSDQYQTLLESANDQAVSQEERDKRKQAADDQLKQLQDRKAYIDQFERQAQVTISDQQHRMRANILDEIKKAVSDKAKAAGYGLVFDTAALTVNETPTIVYSDGNNDLTDDVLKQLNAGAPPDLPDTTAPVFMTTNSLPYNDMQGGTPTTSPASP
jgi:outer membrane protein